MGRENFKGQLEGTTGKKKYLVRGESGGVGFVYIDREQRERES
jgi:hypothetical protein